MWSQHECPLQKPACSCRVTLLSCILIRFSITAARTFPGVSIKTIGCEPVPYLFHFQSKAQSVWQLVIQSLYRPCIIGLHFWDPLHIDNLCSSVVPCGSWHSETSSDLIQQEITEYFPLSFTWKVRKRLKDDGSLHHDTCSWWCNFKAEQSQIKVNTHFLYETGHSPLLDNVFSAAWSLYAFEILHIYFRYFRYI